MTGSAGFVGRHITEALTDRGWHLDGCDIAHGTDCRELFTDERRYGTRRYDLVVHCAAVVGGRTTISNDPLAVAIDLELDAAMFRWAVRTRQQRLVYFSSSAAYPIALQHRACRLLAEGDLDVTAASIGLPDLTYGWAKVTGEVLAGYAEAAGIPVHIFRPFSGYGTDQDHAYPFPAYIARALAAGPAFDVWGDGTQTRDFIHIDDVVAAVLTAVDDDFRLPVNLGTGRATSFDELARLVCAPLGYEPNIRHDTTKPTGPSHRVADVTRMHELYVPKVSLEYGITEALHAKRAA